MGEPIAAASQACFVVAAFSVLGGLVLGGAGLAPGWLAGLCIVEGLVYIGLGLGIRRESRACAWIAAILYTLSTVSLLKAGLAGGLVIRAVITVQLWRAAVQIEEQKAIDVRAATRQVATFAGPAWARQGPAVAVARGRTMRGVRLCMSCKSEHPIIIGRCPSCGRELFDA
jgi:hypothetical protein